MTNMTIDQETAAADRVARINAGLEPLPVLGCYHVLDPLHLVALRARVAKYSTKAVRKGGLPITLWEAADAAWIDRARPDGSVARIRVRQVAVLGDIPDSGDWRFIAILRHVESATILQRVYGASDVTDEALAQYRARGPVCDHCEERRARNETYVIQNRITRETIQCGSSCLAEYTSGNPDAALYAFNVHATLTEEIRAHAALDDAVQAECGAPVVDCVASQLAGDTALAAEIVAEASRAFLPSLIEERRLAVARIMGETTAEWDASVIRLTEALHNAAVILAEGYCSPRNLGAVRAMIAWYRGEAARITRERLAADPAAQMAALGLAALPGDVLSLARMLCDPMAQDAARKLLAALAIPAPVSQSAPVSQGPAASLSVGSRITLASGVSGRIFWRGRGVTRTDTIGVCACGCRARCSNPVWIETSKL